MNHFSFSATEKLVAKARQLVDIKKEDGFAALHLAALNGHRDVVATLLSPTGGCARVDLRNNRRQTPLHLATSQGHLELVELLVKHGAAITAQDEDGDTALHIAITKCRPHPAGVAPSDGNGEFSQVHTVRCCFLSFWKHRILFVINDERVLYRSGRISSDKGRDPRWLWRATSSV